jgi:hypothetical protein
VLAYFLSSASASAKSPVFLMFSGFGFLTIDTGVVSSYVKVSSLFFNRSV